MQSITEEVNEMFGHLGMGVAVNEVEENNYLSDAMSSEISALEYEKDYNEYVFEGIQRRVLGEKTDEREQAQYTFLNELFSMDPTEYRYGDTNLRDNNDEPFNEEESFLVRFGQEGKAPFDGGFQGKGAMDSYDTLKYWQQREEESKIVKVKKDRVGLYRKTLDVNKQFSLIYTSAGELWIPNSVVKQSLSTDKRFILDDFDQRDVTWHQHIKKIDLVKKKPKVNVAKPAEVNLPFRFETYTDYKKWQDEKVRMVAQNEMNNYIDTLRK